MPQISLNSKNNSPIKIIEKQDYEFTGAQEIQDPYMANQKLKLKIQVLQTRLDKEGRENTERLKQMRKSLKNAVKMIGHSKKELSENQFEVREAKERFAQQVEEIESRVYTENREKLLAQNAEISRLESEVSRLIFANDTLSQQR